MTRTRTTRALLAAGTVVTVIAVAGCSSSKGSSGSSSSGTTSAASTTQAASSSSSSSSATTGAPVKVGVITDTTGSASSGYTNTEKGVKAYLDAVNATGGVNGHRIDYVMADSQSTPAGAVTAAQKLVQRDKVFAVISVTSYFFSAEPYLMQQKIPVVGTGFDGPEWVDPKNTNLFNAIGVYPNGAVFTGAGQAVKKLGGTSCGGVGYIESPSAAASAKAFGQSCKAAGLKAPYDTNVHFGSTDVGPIALGMKNAGVDSAFLATVPSTGFALAAALRQVGAKTKAILLPDGYGADLLASAPAVQAAQGFYFSTEIQPSELNTPATQVLTKRLAAVGETGSPGFAESTAYLGLAGFAAGVKAAGANLTPQSFMTALRNLKGYDAEGLLSPNKVDFSSYSPTRQCGWYVRLKGRKFVPVPGLSPICGTLVKK